MEEKTPLMRLAEIRFGCSIEEYIEQRTADGCSVPTIAEEIGVSSQCLRVWIRHFGGESRIVFPKFVPEEASA